MKSNLNVLLFLFLTAIPVQLFAQQPFVLIDSLCGRAEIQKAGKTVWDYVKEGGKLFHNDKIRILEKSKARLRWPDGTTAYVHKNTQILINILQKQPTSTLSHTTVFFGAVFFMIKNILPREITNEMSLYTPDAVVKAKDASILVDVGKETRYTNVKVVEGSAEIQNIHESTKMVLAAPYQVTVNPTDHEIKSKAVLQSDLDSIKEWIPDSTIEQIVTRQIQKSLQISQTLNDNPAKKCIITPFIDSSMYSGPWKLNLEIPKLLSNKLKNAITELSIDFMDAIPRNPVLAAQNKDAQFVILGTILNFEIVDHAEINSQADRYKEQRISKVKLKLTLLETKTGKILVQNNYSGEVSQKIRNDNDWKSLQDVPFDPQNYRFSTSLPALALEQLIEDAVEELSTEIRL